MVDRLATLRKFVAARPDDPFYRYGLAMELNATGAKEESLAGFVELERRFPEYVAQYLMHACLLVELGRGDEARALLGRGVMVAERKGERHALDKLRTMLEELGASI